MDKGHSLQVFRLAERLTIPQLVEAIQKGTIDQTIGQLVLNNKVQMKRKMEQSAAAQQPERPPVSQENMMEGISQVPVGDGFMPNEGGMAGGGIVAYVNGGEVSAYGPYDRPTMDTSSRPSMFGSEGNPISNFLYNLQFPDINKKEVKEKDNGGVDKYINYLKDKAAHVGTSLFNMVSGPPGLQGEAPSDTGPALVEGTQTSIPRPTPRREGIPSRSGEGRGLPGASVPAMNLRSYEDNAAGGDRAERISKLSKAREKELAEGDKETFKGIKELLEKQSKSLSNVDKKNLYMSIIRGGLAAAAGDSQYALQNIARGGAEGVDTYIQRDVLNRANEQQLAHASQLMRLQELAAAKGNRAQADQYGQDLARLEQGDTQLRMQGVDAANRNEISRAELGLKGQQLNQQAVYQQAMIGTQGQRAQAQMATAQARQGAAAQKAMTEFMEGPGKRTEQRLQKQYKDNWQNIPEARAIYDNEMRAYVARRSEFMDSIMGDGQGLSGLGGLGGISGGIPDYDTLMGQ